MSVINWTRAKYLLQYGDDRIPKGINELPSDVAAILPGQQVWSEETGAWVGHDLTAEENERLYDETMGNPPRLKR